MRLLVVYCHPVDTSFCATLRDTVVSTVRRYGHDIQLLDLYASKFNPVMNEQERLNYHIPQLNEQPIKAHLELLRWCEGLIFVYPTWWYGPPAMLKGWIDRVWVPYATFELPTSDNPWKRKLVNIRLIGVVSTLGSSRWWWSLVMGAPGRKLIMRSLKLCCHPRCKSFWLGLHNIDLTTNAQRQTFIEKTRTRLEQMLKHENVSKPYMGSAV